MQRKAEKFTNEFQEAKFVMILENSTHLSSQSNKPADLEVLCTISKKMLYKQKQLLAPNSKSPAKR